MNSSARKLEKPQFVLVWRNLENYALNLEIDSSLHSSLVIKVFHSSQSSIFI